MAFLLRDTSFFFRDDASMFPVKNSPVMMGQRKSCSHMDVPASCVIGNPGSCLHQPHDDPFYRSALVFSPQIKSPNHMEQVVCEKAHLQPGVVRRKTMAARLVPA